MRPADFIILGALMLLGGGIAIKLELVLGELKASRLVNSVPDTVLLVAIAFGGGALFILGLFRLLR